MVELPRLFAFIVAANCVRSKVKNAVWAETCADTDEAAAELAQGLKDGKSWKSVVALDVPWFARDSHPRLAAFLFFSVDAKLRTF